MCGDGEKKTYDSHKLNNFFYIYQILFETGFSFSIYLFSFLHLGFLAQAKTPFLFFSVIYIPPPPPFFFH
jgi:hypothetical protein